MINDLFKDIPVTKIFGTAGAGKTTKLISIVEELLKKTTPDKIVFASFTKKAVEEMIERILIKFPNLDKQQFKYFKTIHALGYSSSSSKKLITYRQLSELAISLGLEISYNINPEDSGGSKTGDKVLTIDSLSRLRMVDLEKQWRDCQFTDIPLYIVKEWRKKLNELKKEKKLVDFTDLLESYNNGAIDADYMIVDEAQDLCPLQWKVINEMSKKCKRVYIAGDDDQLIYKWAGADVNYILNIKADEEIILAKSYRLPSNVYKLSRKILSRIKNRKEKECEPTKEDGLISKVNRIESIKFNKEDYLILIRNKYLSYPIVQYLEEQGLHYSLFGKSATDCKEVEAIYAWEKFRKNKKIDPKSYEKCVKFSYILDKYQRNDVPDRILDKTWFEVLTNMSPRKSNYFRQILAKGYQLNKEPNIKISTIHQAKGGESDNVIVFSDVSYNTYKEKNTEDEHRVWYVAVSRAKQNLTIITGQTNQFYNI